MAKRPRTVILGFDGIDAKLTAALMKSGRLPNLCRMSQIGGLHRVISTTPAESAVAWASFAREANPGRTGVFDFIERPIGSYSPRLAGSELVTENAGPGLPARWGTSAGAALLAGVGGYATAGQVSRRGWLKRCAALAGAGLGLLGAGLPLIRWWPTTRERARCAIAGRAWWDRLSEAGWRCVLMRMPMSYPAQAATGVELLAGLGVPDLRGTSGSYCVIAEGTWRGVGEVHRVQWKEDQCRVQIAGPIDPLGRGGALQATLELKRLGSQAVRICCGGQSQILTKGTWSGWLPVKFSASPIVTLRGMVRVYFCVEEGAMRLYVTPVEIDPTWEMQENPISWPADFAQTVCRGIGRYHTLGWETQTWGLVDGVLDEAAYRADVQAAMELNESQLEWGLGRGNWDAFMLVVQATDQVQHLFFDDAAVRMRNGGEVDEKHPLVEVYRRMDEMVGRVLKWAAAERWRVVVMSDHGFAPYRRAVNLNTWLAKHGWLALKNRNQWDEEMPRFDSAALWENVDWFNTRAYGLGLGGIYLNVAGREPGGIVKRDGEYEHLQERLAEMLLGWCDPKSGQKVCAKVYRNQAVYEGPHCPRGPDLVVGLREGWRVSSASAVGGIPREEMVDNASRWQGDHCGVDAELIPGVCVTSFESGWPEKVAIQTLAGRIWPSLYENKKQSID